MYQTYFKLEKQPFGMTPDPGFLFGTESNRGVLAGLTYAVLAGKGFAVLTGEAGTGKTTLLSRMLRFIPSTQAEFSVVFNPTLSAQEFLESVLMDFGIEPIPSSKLHRLLKLQEFLTDTHAQGKTCVLVVDEAQKLSTEILEEIRLLTNFESAERKLLQIVLSGQMELRNVLNQQNLRQLKQRIAVRFELQPLSRQEVAEYIRFRWIAAGARHELPFNADAIDIIGRASSGIPRIINALCDNALVLTSGAENTNVTAAHMHQVIRALDLGQVDESASRINNGIAKSNGAPPRVLSALNLPPPAPIAETAAPLILRTLGQYHPPERKPGLWTRWAGKRMHPAMDGETS